MATKTLRYMLDTDTCIYIMNDRSQRAFMELTRHDRDEVCVSAVTAAELCYGNRKSQKVDFNFKRLWRFLDVVQVKDFDKAAAQEYGKLRAELEKRGEKIGANDMLIAAHANSLDLTLVTHNVREFARVPGLEVADWT